MRLGFAVPQFGEDADDPEKTVEEIHERAYAGEWPAEFDPRALL